MITTDEYCERRARLIKQMPADSMAVVFGAKEVMRNADSHYRFRQNSDFYYLTGFSEPNAILVLSAKSAESILFCEPADAKLEQWTGKRLSPTGALSTLKVNQAWPITEFSRIFTDICAEHTTVFYPFLSSATAQNTLMLAIDKLKKQRQAAPIALCDLTPMLSEMRLFKSKAEIAVMREANHLSIRAHKRAMQACTRLKYEYELEAELRFELTRSGGLQMAYEPIVGAGGNACVLHYTQNNQPLCQGALVLVDAGGELDNYAADITRTYPVNGQFSQAQRAIYALVLEAQQQAIKLIKPGVRWCVLQETIVNVLTEGLVALNILQGRVDELIAQHAYRPYYMHGSGHWLGLDVHDSGSYQAEGSSRVLEPGMVLTVEPGLYLPAHLDIAAKWADIGVRIEDDILVTHDGYENLTQALPVQPQDIEGLIRG
ncbi:MAG TPA: Xaa-Pro aminopeptidase [Legionellales bacterium]|nr:Xaa-Pro aminopeptidase [Legionellales bacterium]HCA90015.1 Xaa-Pro aminopeptidase [Legionellales bacterium]|tara:strand:- start:623 stop:1915 length:1293 start_codon:yes stop_codon:yes gene_type:complete